jgi:hypothetical protein
VALAADTTRPQMRGLRQRLSTNLTTSPTNASGYKPSDLERDVFQTAYAGGGMPDLLVVSTDWRAGFATWGVNLMQLRPGDTAFGVPIEVWNSPGLGAINILFAPLLRSGTAFTAGWPNLRFEGSPRTSGNDSWVQLFSYQMAVGASIANTTLNGAVSAGATSFVVTAATNIAVGDLLYLGDSSSANWEIVRVKGVSGTTITPEDPVVFAHVTAAAVTDQAEILAPAFDCHRLQRIRVVLDNAGSGQTVAVVVLACTYDSDTSA